MILKFREEEQAKTNKQREEAASRVAEFQKELESVVASEKESGLTKELEQAEAEKQRIKAELDQERVRVLVLKNSLQSRIQAEKDVLFNTCHPDIDSAIEFFAKELTQLRSEGRTSTQRVGGKRNLVTEKKATRVKTNRPALLEAISYCQSAVQTLTNMKLEPVFDPKQVEKIKSNIPDPSQYTQIEGEKAFMVGDPPPAHEGDSLLKRLGIR
ncbi:MAG: hypothetical protein U5R49_22030 [Deltaproteobacteria bacterium]|nr:hypothetical protein [Deltaproteobacteria bacterium]